MLPHSITLFPGLRLENTPKCEAVERNQTDAAKDPANDVCVNGNHLRHIVAQMVLVISTWTVSLFGRRPLCLNCVSIGAAEPRKTARDS